MTNENDNLLNQLPFDFSVRNYMGREDFMVSKCNEKAFALLDAWPNWLSAGLYIYGPKGCGKSHLAHLFADKVKQYSQGKQNVAIVLASQINMRNVKRLAEENQAIVVENVCPQHNNEALFHLFNLFNEQGRYMLWTSEKPANHWHFTLPDLQSRLNMLTHVAIKEPDDMMLMMLIVKLFNDRQIIIGEEILSYIMNNAPRSFAYVRDLVKEIDEISLAYQSAVNYNVVRKAMEVMAEKDSKEPDLFDEY